MDRRHFIKAGVTIAGGLIVDFPVTLAPCPALAQTALSSSLFALNRTMKFINFAKYKDLDRIAGARPAHFAYADRLRAQGKLAIGGPLAAGFLREFAGAHAELTPEAMEALCRHKWPGNVRELRNALERATRDADGNKARAAKRLGISRMQLYGRLRKFGFENRRSAL